MQKEIQRFYFEGVNGIICENCLKNMMVYHALKTLGLIKTNKGGLKNEKF